jgi:glycosyltransferase involved in cell wall biosynthesis
MMLLKLAGSHGFRSGVLGLLKWGIVADRLRAQNIPVRNIGLPALCGFAQAHVVLQKLMKELAPNMIQGWLYHGCLCASLVGKVWGLPVIWNIRQSVQGSEIEKRHALITRAALAHIGASPNQIIYNSEVARLQHEALGFPMHKGVVIPNGFDTDLFRPNDDFRRMVRDELEIPQDAILVGQIGRNHPMKGHAIFLRAAAKILAESDNIYFLVIGRGVDRDPHLREMVRAMGTTRAKLLGERNDLNKVIPALDISTNSSVSGEGFSNAIGESLSCGIPCVVTNVGDSARIVGNAGLVVDAKSVDGLSGAILALATDRCLRLHMATLARHRAVYQYSIDSVRKEYEELYQRVLDPSAAPL